MPSCLMCKLKGSPRVEGDEDEDDVDDIEHEFKMEELKHEEKFNHGDDDENDKSIAVVVVV